MARLFDMNVGQDHEFKLALQNAGMTLEQAVRLANDPELAARMVAALGGASSPMGYPARDFTGYSPYLRSLGSQLELLWELNRQLPAGLQVDPAWLDINTESDHVQSVDDLEFFFVVLDTLEKTLAVNWELVKLTQPAHYHSGFATDSASLALGPNTRWYEPGIHRVRVNLVDNWVPDKGRTIDQVRARIAGTDVLLASVEPVGAYGLHPDLFRQQSGTDLPYTDLAGLRQGRGFGQVPYFNWNGKANLNAYDSDNVNRNYAAPSLQGLLVGVLSSTDFNQPPSMRPISPRRESSCW